MKNGRQILKISEIKKENGTLETWSFSDNRYVELFNGKVLNVRVY